jgi:TolA-binding protein
MTVRSPMTAAVFSGLVGLGLVFGCGKPESAKPAAGQGAGTKEADTHDQPITEADVQKPADFKDAVARIMKYREDIEVAAGGDVPGKAHRSLDELDIVLKWLPGIARDSQVPKDQWETINTSAQQLREQFEKVHGNIDNKKNPDFPAVAKAVDEAIARLDAAAAAKEAKP